jgi:hypothetical protein
MSEAAVSSLERDKIVQAVIGMNGSPAEQSDGAWRQRSNKSRAVQVVDARFGRATRIAPDSRIARDTWPDGSYGSCAPLQRPAATAAGRRLPHAMIWS